jgi:hypothetical protein
MLDPKTSTIFTKNQAFHEKETPQIDVEVAQSKSTNHHRTFQQRHPFHPPSIPSMPSSFFPSGTGDAASPSPFCHLLLPAAVASR